MKSGFIYTSLFLIVLVFSSCNSNKKKVSGNADNTQAEVPAHSSMNSLDWPGTYEGTLPCADCGGIKTIVTIHQDNTFAIKEIYQGKEDSVFESKGTFKWDDQGQRIIVSDKDRNAFFVGENTLTLLDQDGHKVEGDLAERYVLSKVEDQLIGNKWHLTSFKGKEIQLTEAKAEHPYLEFNEDFTIHGYTGCNNLRGGYTLEEGHQFKFSQLISTKKFCPEMETENEFLSTLHKAGHYTFENHALVMYDKDHTKLATFKAAN